MIVDKAVYAGGRRHECPDVTAGLAEVRSRAAEAAEDQPFLWVGLFEPTPEEVREFARLFGMHPLTEEDIVTGRQRPKLDVVDGTALLVFRTLAYFEDNSDVETGEVLIAWGPDWVLTVRHGEVARLDGVRARLERSPELMRHGPAAAVFVVADHVVDTYTAVDLELNDDLLRVESQTFSDGPQVDVSEIYALKREILEARAAVRPVVDPVRHLIETPGLVPDPLRPYLRDVQDHLLRADDHVADYDTSLTDILQAHLSMVSVKQGEDARRISAWAALAVVPTIVGAIYGMNFDHMPELHTDWGYPVVLLLTAAAVVLLHRRFKRSGWL
ncbi:magnesium and cobalt transport protein CorA [Kytococcus sedentarius]|uniref:magnesium and cobalt transport protein CorA n=1 Tax=Kytococcus sedentarius TaxID=1276 RepID=UPI0035BC49F6